MKLFSTPPVLSGKKNKKHKKLLKAQRKALKRADHPFESAKSAEVCRGVVLSNRAYLSILSEVYSRDPLETGGIFFGNVKNDVWYVAEASDPGVYTLHTLSHHEMDNNYHNHIYPVLSRLYQHELRLLGLWHRHPGSLDTFSSDDDRTNHSFAEVIGNGTVSMLVNLDPTARLTCYYLSKSGEYRTVPVMVGDKYFTGTGFLELTTPESLLKNKKHLQAEIFDPRGGITVEKIIITRRELIEQIPAELSEHDKTMSLLNALSERLPKNAEKEDVDLQSGDFEEAFRILDAFDPRTYSTVQLGESLREEQTDSTAKERVGVLGLSDTALPGNDYVGEVTGAGSADTGYYYLLATDETYTDAFQNPDHTTRGLIVPNHTYTALLDENVVLVGYDYFGTYKDGGWLFNRCDEAKSTLTVDSFTLIHDLFSRNTGLFESAEMLKKFAVIIGCGSVGARAALELARAGVGKFLLIDDDILKPHNICRHTHGMRDLGRFKADLLREDILNIDPAAEVTAFRGKLENVPLSLFENLGKNGIVFATADDRSANALANTLSNTLGVPFIAVGCWARAHAGEVFYHIPNRGMKTYGETFSVLLKDAPARDTHGDYFGEADARERLHFEPGTSTDIGFVTLVGVKFALDLLNLESEAYTPRVLNDYTPYTLICNTNRPEIGGENAKIFPYPLYISRSIRPAGEA